MAEQTSRRTFTRWEKIEQSESASAFLSEDLMPLRRCGNTVERAKPITSDAGIANRTLRTVFATCHEPIIGELNRLHFDSCRMPRTDPKTDMLIRGLGRVKMADGRGFIVRAGELCLRVFQSLLALVLKHP